MYVWWKFGDKFLKNFKKNLAHRGCVPTWVPIGLSAHRSTRAMQPAWPHARGVRGKGSAWLQVGEAEVHKRWGGRMRAHEGGRQGDRQKGPVRGLARGCTRGWHGGPACGW